MEFIVLGSGTLIPTKKRNASGYLLKYKDENIVFDFGAGTLKSLLNFDVDYNSIDYIFLTHNHPDHVADLVPLFHVCRKRRNKVLNVYGFKGVKKFVEEIFDLFPNTKPETYAVNFKEMENSKVNIDEITVSSMLMNHFENCIGFKIEVEGKTIIYSGDTGLCENLLELSKNADVLILECSFPNEKKHPKHLTPSEAGEIATKSNAKQLVLTHFYPECEDYNIKSQAKSNFEGEIIIAKDTMKITF